MLDYPREVRLFIISVAQTFYAVAGLPQSERTVDWLLQSLEEHSASLTKDASVSPEEQIALLQLTGMVRSLYNSYIEENS